MSTLVYALFLHSWLFAATKANIRRLSDVTCPPSYEWTFNSLGQSPCEVAAYAMSPCYAGELSYVNALPSDVPSYTGPTLEEANICRCTSVLYSLFSACAACQGKGSGSWSAWKAQCLFPYISALPAGIPEGTAIPAWAFSFYAENDVFNVTAVKLLADSGQADVTYDSDILQQQTPTRSNLMASTSEGSMPKTHESSSRFVDSATCIPTSNTFSASPDTRERALTTAAWVVIGIVILLVIGLAIAIIIRLRRYYRHTRAYRDLQKDDGVTATSPLQIGRGSRAVLRNGYSPVESVLDPELQYVPYNAQPQNLNGQ